MDKAAPDFKSEGVCNIDANFEDLHAPFDTFQAMAESSACLYCYDAPCTKACPTSIDVPDFIRKISTGNIAGAAHTILSQNIMGGTCGRVCPTEVLCEQVCVRNVAEGVPVEIGRLQRYAVDHLLAEQKGSHPFERQPSSGHRIAVVGAGPAGLACAHRLAMLGHAVQIFEAKEKPGGLNEYGLATYKMVDDFAQTEVEFLLQIGGISIDYDSRLGGDRSVSRLASEFDAVFLSIGLGSSNALGLDGEAGEGVEDAIDFIARLRQIKDRAEMALSGAVIVIGGGNTAIDAAVQCKKLGAVEVTLLYRRGSEHMSATKWEQELALKNGVTIRHWAKPVCLARSGASLSVEFERTRLEGGKLSGTGEMFSLEVDLVLKAIGQTLDEGALAGLAIDRGKIVVNGDYCTSLDGVFAGGDCIASGEDLTVQAVEDGKQAAHAMDKFLKSGGGE